MKSLLTLMLCAVSLGVGGQVQTPIIHVGLDHILVVDDSGQFHAFGMRPDQEEGLEWLNSVNTRLEDLLGSQLPVWRNIGFTEIGDWDILFLLAEDGRFFQLEQKDGTYDFIKHSGTFAAMDCESVAVLKDPLGGISFFPPRNGLSETENWRWQDYYASSIYSNAAPAALSEGIEDFQITRSNGIACKDGDLFVWGDTDRSVFTQRPRYSYGFTKVAIAFMGFAIALDSQGKVTVWGEGSGIPEKVLQLEDIIDVVGGYDMVGVITEGGDCHIWRPDSPFNSHKKLTGIASIDMGIIGVEAAYGLNDGWTYEGLRVTSRLEVPMMEAFQNQIRLKLPASRNALDVKTLSLPHRQELDFLSYYRSQETQLFLAKAREYLENQSIPHAQLLDIGCPPTIPLSRLDENYASCLLTRLKQMERVASALNATSHSTSSKRKPTDANFALDREFDPFDQLEILSTELTTFYDGKATYDGLMVQIEGWRYPQEFFFERLYDNLPLGYIEPRPHFEENYVNSQLGQSQSAHVFLKFLGTYNSWDRRFNEKVQRYGVDGLNEEDWMRLERLKNSILKQELILRVALEDGTIISGYTFRGDVETISFSISIMVGLDDLTSIVSSPIAGLRLETATGEVLNSWNATWTQTRKSKSMSQAKALLQEFGHLFTLTIPDACYEIQNNLGRSADAQMFSIGGKDLRDVDTYQLTQMVQIFLTDCRLHDIAIRGEQKIQATFEPLGDDLIALAFGKDFEREIIIKVDPTNWQRSSLAKKWYILYHELGHDVLNLEHGQGGKMMFNFANKEYRWEEFLADKEKMFDYARGLN